MAAKNSRTSKTRTGASKFPELSADGIGKVVDFLAMPLAKTQGELQREHVARDGVTLRGEHLRRAQDIATECAMAMLSFQQIALSATCSSDVRETAAMLGAAEGQAKWMARRCDVLLALLGDVPVGTYADELMPLPEAEHPAAQA